MPSLFGMLIGTDVPLADYRASKRVNDVLARKINDGLRAHGVLVEPDYQEPWFLSYSHSEGDVDETLEIFERVIVAVK